MFIRPGTDALFYASFLCELIAIGGVDDSVVAAYTTGYDALKQLAEAWPAERTAEATGVTPETLRAMVQAYAQADGAALYCSTGVNMGGQGALAFWLQETINAVSGNLDRRGGTLVGKGIFDFPKLAKRSGTLMSDARSRVGGFGQVNDAFPGGVLADEILTPGDGQIRALFVTGGNPLLTMADAGKLRDAVEQLELLVVLDILPNETAQHADVVLPCTSPMQRPDLPFVFPLWLGMQARPYLQATRAVVPPEGGQRDEATIYTLLAKACDAPMFGSRALQKALELAMRDTEHGPRLPLEAILSIMLRLSGEGGFDALADRPHGVLRDDHPGGDFLGARLLTDDGKVHLAPEPLLEAAAERLEHVLTERRRDGKRLRLITRRAVTTHNSWTHNLRDFRRGRTRQQLPLHARGRPRARRPARWRHGRRAQRRGRGAGAGAAAERSDARHGRAAPRLGTSGGRGAHRREPDPRREREHSRAQRAGPRRPAERHEQADGARGNGPKGRRRAGSGGLVGRRGQITSPNKDTSPKPRRGVLPPHDFSCVLVGFFARVGSRARRL